MNSEKQIRLLNQKLKNSNTNNNKLISQENHNLNIKLVDMEKENQVYKNKLEEIMKQINNIKKSDNGNNNSQEVINMVNKTKNLEFKINQLNQEIFQLKKGKDILELTNANLLSEIEKINQNKTSQNQNTNDINISSAIKKKEEEIEGLNAFIQKLTKQSEKYSEDIETYKIKINSLQKENTSIKKQLERLTIEMPKELNALKIQLDEIKVENDDENINNFNKNKKKKKDIKYKKIFKKSLPQKAEGFAIDWNNITPFVLAVGGYDKKISIYKPKDENISDIILYGDYLSGHTDSVEDIQWSPNEENVLASCGIDRSIRFWDVRQDSKNPPKIIKDAHTSDVNVISWNTVRNHLFASGGDDNTFKVWDLRYITEPPITEIKWHTGPINSIMWDPFDESQLAVCSEDNRLSVWDFSVEPDEKKLFDNYNNEIPQQLVFLHQGQINLKDVKFHPVFKNMLISSAENGLNLFRPNFTDEASEDDNDEDDKMEEEKEINKNDQ